jgi:hypothetical protein
VKTLLRGDGGGVPRLPRGHERLQFLLREALAAEADEGHQPALLVRGEGVLVVGGARLAPELRRECLREVVRVAGNTASEVLRTSPMWRAWIGVWALSASGNKSTASEEIKEALSATYDQIDLSALDFYTQALSIFGVRLKPGISLHSFAVAASSIIEGCSLRDLVDPAKVAPLELPTGANGEFQTWSLQSVALMALVDSLTEIAPDDAAN